LVSVDKMAPQEGATDLVVSAAGLFEDFVALHGLAVEWQVRAAKKVSRSHALLVRVMRELELKESEPMVWVDGERECWPDADDPDLIELHIACTMVL
jgi:hypothetical protein